jgi:hypothetical protein
VEGIAAVLAAKSPRVIYPEVAEVEPTLGTGP